MKKVKKKYIIIFSIIILLILFTIIFLILYSLFSQKHYISRKTVNVFGAPSSQSSYHFPTDEPEFTALVGYIKPSIVQQQSITIYRIGDSKKTPLFTRQFYADGFRGAELIYHFSSHSAEIEQSGSLGAIGCKTNDCTLPWTNYYLWNAKQKIFILNNLAHVYI